MKKDPYLIVQILIDAEGKDAVYVVVTLKCKATGEKITLTKWFGKNWRGYVLLGVEIPRLCGSKPVPGWQFIPDNLSE